jgi:hypothetical protein
MNGRKALSTTIPLVTAFPSKWLMILLQRLGMAVLSATKKGDILEELSIKNKQGTFFLLIALILYPRAFLIFMFYCV